MTMMARGREMILLSRGRDFLRLSFLYFESICVQQSTVKKVQKLKLKKKEWGWGATQEYERINTQEYNNN